jgi:hypothetical protein
MDTRSKGSLPRFPKIESFYISRLIYARQNCRAALEGHLMSELKSQIATKSRRVFNEDVKVLTIDMLLTVKWVEMKPVMQKCQYTIEDGFNRWCHKHREQQEFKTIDRKIEVKSLRELTELVRPELLRFRRN